MYLLKHKAPFACSRVSPLTPNKKYVAYKYMEVTSTKLVQLNIFHEITGLSKDIFMYIKYLKGKKYYM